MNRIANLSKNLLITGALASFLCGCSCRVEKYEERYTEGEVLKEGGSIVNPSTRESHNNSEQTYVLTVKTTNGIYFIDVRNYYRKPLSALSEAVEIGDTVRFREDYPAGNINSRFSNDRVGSLSSVEIQVIKKEDKLKIIPQDGK